MAVKFNPFTGNLQLDQVGTGGGGGSSVIEGEVDTYADLPLDGTATLNSSWLVRTATGTWFTGGQKPAGIYIRINTVGSSRDNDYVYAGLLPSAFSDNDFTLYDETDTTKLAKFQLSGIAAGTTRTISVPDKNITLDDAGDTRPPASHTHTAADIDSQTASNGHVLTADGSGGSSFAALPASGVSAIGASAADILSVSGSDLVADDLGADKLYGWDDSAGKAVGFTIGSGLTVTDDTISASGGIGGSTGSTDNAILRADGTGGATAQATDIVIDDATTSTQNNVAITNQHSGQTNSALVLTPKGTGAFYLGPRANGSTTGGNSRGIYAADLQIIRNGASKVASGNYSFVAGVHCTASGQQCVSVGWENAATGTGSGCFGGAENTSSGSYTFATNYRNTASATAATAVGEQAAANRAGLMAHGGGRFSGSGLGTGEAQRIHAVLRETTTNATATELFIGVSGTNRLTIASGRVMAGIINCVGVKSDGSAVAHYVRKFCGKNVAGTSSLVGTVTTIGTDQEDNASTDIAVTISDADDAVTISVTGIVSETWRWVASVDAVEVAYGS